MTARPRSLAAVIGAGMCAVLALPGAILLDRLHPPPLPDAFAISPSVLDRKGRLLRAYPVADGRWRLPVRVAELDPEFLRLLVAYEDKRFFDHGGVDPLALGRAAWLFLRHGRIVSGGSTLTMQLARLMEPRNGRSLPAKLGQIARAWQIERRLSKSQILEAYLTLAPYGGNLEGVRSAALAYFGKEPHGLTYAESALLVALPQAPEARRPDRDAHAARRARDRVLKRLVATGALASGDGARAAARPLVAARRPFPTLAAHAADEILRRDRGTATHRLAIDRDLQAALERLAGERAREMGAHLSVAILVADHRNGEIVARLGSADFFDAARAGQVDMTRAPRSPGSTLKPFIYALAFETGQVAPATLIEDRPVDFAGYRPRNFDFSYQGTVSVREALQMSLNVPAVMLLDGVGPARLMARFRRAGVVPRLPVAEVPGLAIGLGGLGMSLRDLVTLYAALARGGDAVVLSNDPVAGRSAPAPHDSRILEARASWQVADILAGVPPPVHAAGGRIAYKTGTSYGYRDSWAVGFDGRHVVGVWVGRPDGSSVPDLTGRGNAAPILFDSFARIGPLRAPLPAPPPGGLPMAAADLPPGLRHFVLPSDPGFAVRPARPRLAIVYPPDGAHVDLAAGGPENPLVVKVQGGAPPFRWLANGRPIEAFDRRRAATWQPDGKGFSTLTVIDADGRSDRVGVFVE